MSFAILMDFHSIASSGFYKKCWTSQSWGLSPIVHNENSAVDDKLLLLNPVPLSLVSLLFVEAGKLNPAFPRTPCTSSWISALLHNQESKKGGGGHKAASSVISFCQAQLKRHGVFCFLFFLFFFFFISSIPESSCQPHRCYGVGAWQW